MKTRFLFGFFMLSLSTLAAPPSGPFDKSLAITANRKQANVDRKMSKDELGNPSARKTDLVYNITVMNEGLKDVAGMEMKYNIFLDREKLGSKTDGTERMTGKATVNGLKSREKQTVETEDFALTAAKLAPGWYYAGGGKTQTRETVKGIWVRLYRDGVLVNELISPSTLANKETFKD